MICGKPLKGLLRRKLSKKMTVDKVMTLAEYLRVLRPSISCAFIHSFIQMYLQVFGDELLPLDFLH